MSIKAFFRKIFIVFMPQSYILRTRLKDGLIVMGTNKRGYGGRGIYLQREELEYEFKHLQDFISETDNFLDIGANTGIYSLKAAKYAKKGTIISLEPQIEMLSMLERSAAENGFDNIRLRNLAASDRVEATQLCLLNGKPNSASIVVSNQRDKSISVMTVTVDLLMDWEKIGHIDYIKIDAEGAESMILKGALVTISRCRPLIQCEDNIVNMKEITLEGYVTLKHPESINVMFVPADHKKLHIFLERGFEATAKN